MSRFIAAGYGCPVCLCHEGDGNVRFWNGVNGSERFRLREPGTEGSFRCHCASSAMYAAMIASAIAEACDAQSNPDRMFSQTRLLAFDGIGSPASDLLDWNDCHFSARNPPQQLPPVRALPREPEFAYDLAKEETGGGLVRWDRCLYSRREDSRASHRISSRTLSV